jgi:hypothetical protein
MIKWEEAAVFSFEVLSEHLTDKIKRNHQNPQSATFVDEM